MKVRDSGMPNEGQLESYFDPEIALDRLGLAAGIGNVVEFGCGYGTFTPPAANCVATGIAYAFDVEPEMVAIVATKASESGLGNILAEARYFMDAGTGLPDCHADYAM